MINGAVQPALPTGRAGPRRRLRVRGLLSLEGIRYAAFLAVFVVLIGGAVYSVVEDDQHLSAWDGIWWAVTTVTTVGYGDIATTTDAGRVIAIVVMAVGIGFVALLTAFVADRFIRQDEEVEQREARMLAELRAIRERLDRLEG